MPLTEQGKEKAVYALKYRRETKPKQIDNSRLHAGSPMYFYCVSCGHLSDILNEGYLGWPKKLCEECQALKELGWLE